MVGGFFIVDEFEDIMIFNYCKYWYVIFELLNDKKLIYLDICCFGEIRNVVFVVFYFLFLEIVFEFFLNEVLMYYLNWIY